MRGLMDIESALQVLNGDEYRFDMSLDPHLAPDFAAAVGQPFETGDFVPNLYSHGPVSWVVSLSAARIGAAGVVINWSKRA